MKDELTLEKELESTNFCPECGCPLEIDENGLRCRTCGNVIRLPLKKDN